MIGPFIEQLVARSVNGVLDGILVAAAAWLLLRLTGTRNSGLRFAVWFSALLAIAGMFGFRNSSLTVTHSDLPEITIAGKWAIYLFAVWATLAFVALARVGIGLWRLRRIRKNSQRLDPALLSAETQAEVLRLPSVRRASVRISDQVRVPMAVGFFRPAVLLPHWAVEELSPEELHSVLLHELAHLRRWDDWTNLAQKVIRAMLFFHPAVWWVESRLSLEREMSCDDMVLAHSDSPRQYAECLVTVAERGFLRRPVALAQAAVARMKHTAQRISKILDGRQRRIMPVWRPAVGALTTFIVLGAAAVEHTPQLVGFDTPAQAAHNSAVQEFGGHVVPVMASTRGSEPEFAARPKPIVKRAFHKRKSEVASESRIAEAFPAASDREADFRGITRPPSQMAGAGIAQVVNASAKRASPAFMLVVFQTQEYDQFGNVVVRTYLWRIAVPAQAAIPPRST